ncbi:hypothetical protein Tco_1140498 [Tanacetum coccineum]
MENKVNEEDHSLSHPPGFTPEVDQFEGNAMGDIAEKVYTEKENDVNSFVNKDIGNNDSNSVNNNVEPTDLDRSKLLRSGGSILNFMEEVVKRCVAEIGIDLFDSGVYAPQDDKGKHI